MTTNRYPRAPSRRSALRASLAPALLIPALLLVPAALPLCDMGAEACFTVVPGPAAPSAGPGDHCPMEAAALDEMPCCVRDAGPVEPTPVTPPKADTGLQVKLHLQVPVVAVTSTVTVLPGEVLARVPAPALAAPAVPLYTLLSTLIS